MLADRIAEIQRALTDAEIDGWLFAVFQGNDPISLDLLGLTGRAPRHPPLLLPRSQPRRAAPLVHDLEPAMLDHLPGTQSRYRTWQEHRSELERLVRDCRRLAAQYSPKNELPERLAARRRHRRAPRLVRRRARLRGRPRAALRRGLDRPSSSPATGAPTSTSTASCARRSTWSRRTSAPGARSTSTACSGSSSRRSTRSGLHAEADPIVGVNAHAADPHYDAGRRLPRRRSGRGELPARRPLGEGEGRRAASTPTSPGAASARRRRPTASRRSGAWCATRATPASSWCARAGRARRSTATRWTTRRAT